MNPMQAYFQGLIQFEGDRSLGMYMRSMVESARSTGGADLPEGAIAARPVVSGAGRPDSPQASASQALQIAPRELQEIRQLLAEREEEETKRLSAEARAEETAADLRKLQDVQAEVFAADLNARAQWSHWIALVLLAWLAWTCTGWSTALLGGPFRWASVTWRLGASMFSALGAAATADADQGSSTVEYSTPDIAN